MQYGTTFFKNSGISNACAFPSSASHRFLPLTPCLNLVIITIITNCVNVAMTIPGLLAVDRFGRRTLLLIGACGMAVCHFIVAITGTVISDDNEAGQRVLIA